MDSNPIIILLRNSSISSRRLRVPHLVSNQTLSLYNPIDEIKLVCRANYPVQWFRGHEKVSGYFVINKVQWSILKKRQFWQPLYLCMFQQTNSSKIGKVPCSNQSTKKVYEAVLHIDQLHKEGTGNYTCRKTFATTPQASAYIYAVGMKSIAMITTIFLFFQLY